MAYSIKFIHINIVAKDWKKLAQFYIDTFTCIPYYPERDLQGEWLEHLTNIQEVSIKGIHLKLPGYQDGPTLEIFQYFPDKIAGSGKDINSQGFRHIAFHVEDIEEILALAIKNGAKKYGELVETKIAGLGIIKVVYIKDPEGNIVELQNLRKP